MKKIVFFGIFFGVISLAGLEDSTDVYADEVSDESSQVFQQLNVLEESFYGDNIREGHSIVKRDKGDNPYNRSVREHPNKLSNPGKLEKCVAQGITGGNPWGFAGGAGQCILWQK